MRFLAFFSFCFFISCKTTQNPSSVSARNLPENVSLNGKIYSSLFQQRSAEYRALCLQGYNIAKMRIDGAGTATEKPFAIITDIDETILDNSPYAVHRALEGFEYGDSSWYAWTGRSAADTMPGSASLLKYAALKKITVFYITNRDPNERSATLKNLQRFNLPNADEAHLFTRPGFSSKELRRQNIMKDFDVIFLMGDNLADFSNIFDKKTEAERKNNVDQIADLFGKKFIIFPNANYGDWEGSLYNYNYRLTQAQKDSVMKSVLKSY